MTAGEMSAAIVTSAMPGARNTKPTTRPISTFRTMTRPGYWSGLLSCERRSVWQSGHDGLHASKTVNDGVKGLGVDLSSAFIDAARSRAIELGVSERVRFEHGDAAGYVAAERVHVAACLGATPWIGGGVLGTVDLLTRSLRSDGLVLIGEPYWVHVPASDDLARACHARHRDEWSTLPELLSSFADHGLDLVQMVLAGPDDWDAYHGLQWLNLRRWLDANRGDELWAGLRAELDRAPAGHLITRKHLGWGAFALMPR